MRPAGLSAGRFGRPRCNDGGSGRDGVAVGGSPSRPLFFCCRPPVSFEDRGISRSPVSSQGVAHIDKDRLLLRSASHADLAKSVFPTRLFPSFVGVAGRVGVRFLFFPGGVVTPLPGPDPSRAPPLAAVPTPWPWRTCRVAALALQL